MPDRETLPYGAWRSPITSDLIVAQSIGLGDVLADGADIWWIETRPGKGGRNVLVRRGPKGSVEDVTPPPFSVRTRVHEYGGGAACLRRGMIFFSNFADQRLYRQAGGSAPEPLTPEGTGCRYANGLFNAARQRWIGVREEHAEDGRVDNTLVALELETPGPGRVLAQGHDFYASPALSPDGKRLAWLTWDHPNMPWVGTELWLAEIAADGLLGEPLLVAAGPAESIFQPQWSPDGVLHFVSDRTGWWNLYRCEPGGGVRPLCPREAEFGQAQWNFGQSTYAFLSEGRLVCAYTEAGRSRLALLDIASGELRPIELPFTDFGQVRAAEGPGRVPRRLARRPAVGGGDRPGDRRIRGAAAVGSGRRRRRAAPLFLGAAAPRLPDRKRPDRLRELLPAGQPRSPPAAGREAAAGREMPWRADRVGLDRAEPRHPVLDEPRHRRARCRLRRQHRLWPRLSRAAQGRLGRRRCRRLRQRGSLRGRRGPRRRRARGHHRAAAPAVIRRWRRSRCGTCSRA